MPGGQRGDDLPLRLLRQGSGEDPASIARLRGAGAGGRGDRGYYDTNSSGDAAPQTTSQGDVRPISGLLDPKRPELRRNSDERQVVLARDRVLGSTLERWIGLTLHRRGK